MSKANVGYVDESGGYRDAAILRVLDAAKEQVRAEHLFEHDAAIRTRLAASLREQATDIAEIGSPKIESDDATPPFGKRFSKALERWEEAPATKRRRESREAVVLITAAVLFVTTVVAGVVGLAWLATVVTKTMALSVLLGFVGLWILWTLDPRASVRYWGAKLWRRRRGK